ncbi:MAG: ClC family H(+)/Cl(-) exchange transporter [Limosilactobacillus sp.]|nr:ClC family H(+)/Cl(-) exchange transporter [Limosilactobacillus sp.]
MIKLTTRQILNRPFSSKLLSQVLKGLLVGVITGLIVSIFRLIIDHTLQFLYVLYPYLRLHPVIIIPYGVLMVLNCWGVGKLIGPYLTNIVGSGVPQIEAIMLKQNQMAWWSILWRKFVAGLLVICPGLFLGREGPCIQMGAAVGQGLAEDVFKVDEDERNLLLACGVAAGLAAAFSAPIAGVLFLVEEITFNFKPKVILPALSATVAADLVTILFFGTQPCLYLPIKTNLPVSAYGVLIVVGVLLGVLGYVYQYSLLSLRGLYGWLDKLPRQYHSVIPLLLVIPIGLWQPILLGGSHNLINRFFTPAFITQLMHDSTSMLSLMVVFLIIRFGFSMVSYGASVPGGIFMPILALGALLGVIGATVMIGLGLVPLDNYANIVVICMAGYFGAIEKAPVTAVTLLCEMVGTVDQILPMLLVTFVAYLVIDFLGGRPIYEALRDQIDFKGIPVKNN